MPILPFEIMPLLVAFAPVFSSRVWRHVPILVMGAILTPGARMVSRVLRVMGLEHEAQFQTYHRVLNRAVWSSLAVSRILLGLLLATFAATGPLVVGIDESIERRRGRRIWAKGRFRDPVRSTQGRPVMVSGLRWISMMLLVPIPWAHRTWALPFLTVLAPAERSNQAANRRHKSISVWARQMIRVLHRWHPTRQLVIVGDGSYAVLDLLDAVRPIATVVTRVRFDAQLFALPPARSPGQRGRPARMGARLPKLSARLKDPTTPWTRLELPRWYGGQTHTIELVWGEAIWYSKNGQPPVPIRWVLLRDPDEHVPPLALLCTDLTADPAQIISWYIQRWQLEVTFHEARASLGMETQRQWSDRAIARTTPALLGLFSLVTLLAHEPMLASPAPIQSAAWYDKHLPTFSDALALVRRALWTQPHFALSASEGDRVEIPRALLDRLCDTLAYAA